VHPENYELARVIKGTITATGNITGSSRTELKQKYTVGDTTIDDIFEELRKPGLDPREAYPKPIMQKGVVTFEDLKEGMTVTGKIKNVVDFGAFVDLGLKETALVHVSELSDNFVKNPMDVIKAGDVLEFRIIGLDTERRRISLSRRKDKPKTEQPQSGLSQSGLSKAGPQAKSEQPKSGQSQSGLSRSGQSGYAPRRAGDSADRGGRGRGQYSGSDDGTMYNPFAEAFKHRK
jgi:uncharacterized protein